MDDQDIYKLEAYDDRGNSCGGRSVKSKEELKELHRLWQERYPTLGLRYVFYKNDKRITL